MAKLDLEAAYRHVPVHPDDQGLLAVKWGDEVYVDSALPFGLRSAPKIFTAVADGIAWCMSCSGIKDFIHYLDDFLFVGPPGSSDCLRALEAAIPLCESLGFPVAPHKVEGPSTSITFLGIEVDSCQFELRLLGLKKECHQAAASVTDWAAEPCSHSCQTGQDFLEGPN